MGGGGAVGGVRGPNGAGAVGVTVFGGGGGCPDGCLDLDVLLERRGGSFDWPLPEEFFLQPKMNKKLPLGFYLGSGRQ